MTRPTSADIPVVHHETAPSTGRIPDPGVGGLTPLQAHESARLWFGRCRLAPGSQSLPHRHAGSEQAVHVLSGTMVVRFGNGSEVVAGPGDFVFVPPGLPHQELNPGTAEVDAFVAMAPGHVVEVAALGSDGGEVTVVHGVTETTGQTYAMTRSAGIHRESAPTRELWFGKATGIPNVRAGRHHHGEAETWGYIASGHVRVFHGEGYDSYVDARAGDYIFVPAWIHHQEVTMEKQDAILARSPDNIVVNLDQPPGG